MQSKGTTIKEAISKWEQQNGKKASETKEIKLIIIMPPIEKMDAGLSAISHVERLSLSNNCIEKITNLNPLKHLKVLSIGRNNIKLLTGLEVVAETLEELWVSYNQIEKLSGLAALKKLKVLYASNNLVKDWAEFQKLCDLPLLEDLLFVGNPLEEKHSIDGTWRNEASKYLTNLRKLDGVPVIRENKDDVIMLALQNAHKEADNTAE